MKKYGFMTVRELLGRDGNAEEVFKVVAWMLGWRQEGGDEELRKVYLDLLEKKGHRPWDQLVMIPSRCVKDGFVGFPTFGLYRMEDTRGRNTEVPAWDTYTVGAVGGLLTDESWGRIRTMDQAERFLTLFRGRRFAEVLEPEKVSEPMEILVNDPMSAAAVVAWALRGLRSGPAFVIDPLRPVKLGNDVPPETVYSELSRYAALTGAQDAIWID